MNAVLAIRVVTGLFLLAGVGAVAAQLQHLAAGRGLVPMLGYVALPVAWGLARRRDGWRSAALLLLGGQLVLCGLALGRTMAGAPPSRLHLPVPVETPDVPAALALLVGALVVILWQLWALTRPEVRRHFIQEPAAGAGLWGAGAAGTAGAANPATAATAAERETGTREGAE
jgi:hypothetical protein